MAFAPYPSCAPPDARSPLAPSSDGDGTNRVRFRSDSFDIRVRRLGADSGTFSLFSSASSRMRSASILSGSRLHRRRRAWRRDDAGGSMLSVIQLFGTETFATSATVVVAHVRPRARARRSLVKVSRDRVAIATGASRQRAP